MKVFGDNYDTKDGTCIRDYVHVDDLAQAHIDGYNYLTKGGKSDTFNCGYNQGYTVLEVLDAIEKVTNKKLSYTIGERRAGDATKLISQANKIKKHLNWQPKYYDLEMICKTAYEWEKKI